MEPTKSIHKKTLKERVFASYVKHKNEEFDQRDANVKFLKKVHFFSRISNNIIA